MLTQPTVTGWSSFWALTGDQQNYYPTPVSQKGYRTHIQWQLARLLKRNQTRDLVAAMVALNGAAVGGTATSTYKQVHSQTFQPTFIGEFAGNRQIDTITAINRATTAADQTFINDMLNNALLEAGITYPTDASGVGGGGKIVGGTPTF